MPRQTARRETDAIILAQAQRTAAAMIKSRARIYAARPETLENLCPGLSSAPAETMISIAEHSLRIEILKARRWFGFGGEVEALNAKAALLLGRTLRRLSARATRLKPPPA